MSKPITDKTGMIRHTVRLSLSHSAFWMHEKDPTIATQTITDEVFAKFVKKHGMMPKEKTLFRVYLPKATKRIKSMFLISQHGVGIHLAEHPIVRSFADKNQMAIIGVAGNPIQRGICPVSVLDGILKDISLKVNHPELATAPALTFGHSNGTGFSALYAALRPDRVIGWISYHSGGSWHLAFPRVEKVPGLVMHGPKDRWIENGQEQTVKDLRSKRNAPVSMTVEVNAGHSPTDRGATFAYILAFCEACLRTRIPECATGAPPLKPVNIEAGWLGGNYDLSKGGMQKLPIAPYGEFSGDKSRANWLPDATFAKFWQTYCQHETISPK